MTSLWDKTRTLANVQGLCEHSDTGCTAHKGKSQCKQSANTILYRVDMEDISGTLMCDDCADCATKSGLFIEADDPELNSESETSTVTPNPAPKTSDYSQEYLSKRSVETFLAISGGYPKGHCRMNGTCSWFLRVSNHGASLVTTYQTKDESGQWSGTNEHSEAL